MSGRKLIKASGADFPKLGDKVPVTKLWMHCRDHDDKDAAVRSGRIQERDEDKLVDTVHNDINDLWSARHHVKLGYNRWIPFFDVAGKSTQLPDV